MPKRVKQPEETRRKVVTAGIRELRKHGYQGASLNTIVETSGVTKGAFFHHFRSKRDMALAALEEVEGKRIRKTWIDPIGGGSDGITSILSMIEAVRRSAETHPSELAQGSTLWNVSTEMSPQDEGFRSLASKLYGEWVTAWETALRRDSAEGRLSSGHDCHALAEWIVESVEGALAAARIHISPKNLGFSFSRLAAQLESLRRPHPQVQVHKQPASASTAPAEEEIVTAKPPATPLPAPEPSIHPAPVPTRKASPKKKIDENQLDLL